MSDNVNIPASIADATLFALQQGGREVLQSPQRLLSYLVDIAADSNALTVLERNCDQEFLEPLTNVICGGEPPTMQGIRLAASRMEDLLVNGRAVAAQPAHEAVEQLCRGVVRYLAERSGAVPRPAQAATGPIPAPMPVQQPAEADPQVQPQDEPPIVPAPHEPVVLPAVSDAPDADDPRGPSRTGTMPVEVVAPSQDQPSAGAAADGTSKQDSEQVVAPIQPPKKKDHKKLLAILGAIAAVAIVAYIMVSLNRVTVSFDGAGAMGSTHSIKTWRDSEVSLPSNGYTRTGYSFMGWDLNGTTYQPGDAFKPTGSTTLKAIWAAEVSFDDNGADSGSVDDVLALPGDTITLPKLDYKRDGYRANGWEANGELYAAGDKVTVNGPITYSASWGARVSFDGNGASSGKTSDLYGDQKGSVSIPKCGFSYPEHVFKGWATSSSGSARYSPGDSLSSSEPTTLYAVWELNPKIMDKVELNPVGVDWDSGAHTTMILATNNSKIPLTLSATFKFLDASGNELSSASDRKMYVAPGETTSLDQYCEQSGFSSCDYKVTATEVTTGSGPLHGNVSLKEESVEAGKIVLRLTNNASEPAYIKSLTYYGKGYNGGEAMYYEYPRESIAPGDHLDITIESTISADSARWNEYHTRNYYLDGYLE